MKWISLVILIISVQVHAMQDWRSSARALFGENLKQKEAAKAYLNKRQDLAQMLRNNLIKNEEIELTLKVISELKLKALLPEVISFSKNQKSEKGPLTLLSLKDSSNTSQINHFFQDIKIELTTIGFPARKMIIIQALKDLPYQFNPESSKAILLDESYEVRIAFSQYASHRINIEGLGIISNRSDFISAKPIQARQAFINGSHVP